MEAWRKPDGLGTIEQSTPLDLQIHLGEMDEASGLLSTEQKYALLSMKDAVIYLGKIAEDLTTQQVIDASIPKPIQIGTPKSIGVLLSM